MWLLFTILYEIVQVHQRHYRLCLIGLQYIFGQVNLLDKEVAAVYQCQL